MDNHITNPLGDQLQPQWLSPINSVDNSRFIVFEGGDGMGKSTQIELCAQALRQAGHDVVVTRNPGGTPLGKVLREAIQQEKADQHSEVDNRAELLMYLADRAQHVAHVVVPALEAGSWVLCDRFEDSSVAYQSGGRGFGSDEVRTLSRWSSGGLFPGTVFVLDGTTELAAQRRGGGKLDRIEAAGEQFHNRVRWTFLNLATAEPERYLVLDAERTVEDIHAQVMRRLLGGAR